MQDGRGDPKVSIHPSKQWCFYQGDFVSQDHWAVSGDMFICHNWVGGATGIWWDEARDAAECPTTPRTAHHRQELSSRKYQ